MESSLDTGHFHASYTKRYLQLSNTRARDRLYWKENEAQQFTVKTTYQVALRLNREVGVEHSTVGEEKRFWNRIWRMNVPP